MIQKIKAVGAFWFVLAIERYIIRPMYPDPNQHDKGMVRGVVSAMIWFILLAPPFLAALLLAIARLWWRSLKTNKEESA